jgi:ABC-type lipoprotein release transport system permease subunit
MSQEIRLISRLAYRDIFRNTRRTLLTIALISCGLAALLLADSFVRGSLKTFISISTETFLGEAQIHQQGFRDSQDIDIFIPQPKKLYQQLQNYSEIKAYSPRTLAGAMISSSENVSGGMIIGIDGEKESQISKLKKSTIKGNYLSGEKGEILLGSLLADLLEVDLGDRIVVTLSQANGGELSQELFRVSGIFSFNDRNMDNTIAFINLEQSQQLLNINGVHQVALIFETAEAIDNKNLPIWQDLNTHNLETLDWLELTPQLAGILGMVNYTTLIIALIMYILVALGLINTMLMSIFERRNEFGILLAIGTRPRQLFWQIMCEGFFIGAISMVVGLFIGGSISLWASINGLRYDDLEMMGATINEPIYAVIDYLSFIELSISILLITLLACLYPALHAARLQPSDAMRKTL